MLVQFSVGNFRSFKDTVTLDLVATKDKILRDKNTFEASGGLRLLKSVVLFGANASGKSNLLKALEFMKTLVEESAKESQVDEPINTEPFLLDSKSEKEPSVFEIIFILDNVKYRYGFEVTTKEVVSEWLYHTTNKKEAYLFTRDFQTIKISRNFGEGQKVKELTRNNTLFISLVSFLNGKIASNIIRWFKALETFSGQKEFAYHHLSATYLKNESFKNSLRNLILKLDLAISDIYINTRKTNLNEIFIGHLKKSIKKRHPLPNPLITDIPKEEIGENAGVEVADVLTTHKKYNGNKARGFVTFDLYEHESDGTQRLFALASAIVKVLASGSILVIDEIDARFHPLLTAAVIDVFQSPEDNPKNAQIIFATHDVNLLENDRFRRDQIWFVEKDRIEVSHLYSLADFNPRNDAIYHRNYLQGRYGAIPFIDARNFMEGWSDGETP
jgi:uncharacterized protein